MKKVNLLKASSLLIVALVVAAFLFTSTNTTDKSNDQVITELSERLATMEAAKEANEFVGGNPFLGEISLFTGYYAPKYYAFCHGQILSIKEYELLFSILGTTYGGDGRSTFALPDLRGRVAIGAGQGPGLKNVELGQKGGVDEGRLNVNKIKVSQDGNNITEVISNIEGNKPPYTAINYIICLDGIYPPRQ